MILEQAAALKDSVPIILHHHERFAGHGYPYGLRGSEIPMGARIVAIADAYDAMVNDRPYKRAMSHADAVQELRIHAGTQFDPELVTVFCDLFASLAPEPDETILAINAMHSHRGVPVQLVAADGLTPAVSGPRVARHHRVASGSGMADATARPPKPGRGQIRSAGDPARQGPGPSAIREETSTAAAEAHGRMELTDTGSGPPAQAPDSSGSPSSDRPRGIVSG